MNQEQQQQTEQLKALAEDKNIRDSRKLYQYARAKGMDITQAMASAALKDSVQRQVLAPPQVVGILLPRDQVRTSKQI